MKEYKFTAKAVSFVEDGPVKRLLVYCHEREDCKLVIEMGASQLRVVQDAAESTGIEVVP